MEAIVPVEVDPGRPGARMIYYELTTMFLKPSFRANWDAFVGSGTTGVWHCLHRVFAASHGPVARDGRCERHGQTTCLRVMLRREGGVVRTLFTSGN
jgi:hypothetical protein